MDWLLVALSAYLFLAIANLLDKFLVDNVLKSSQAYVFIVCILGLAVMLVSPWFLKWPGLAWSAFNLFVGILFAIALWLLYEALKQGEAARILVFIGGLIPVFSIILSLIFLKDVYTLNQWIGMGFLLAGVLVIALLPQPRNFLARFLKKIGLKNKFNRRGLQIAFVSALFYSFYFVASKYAYNNQPFMSAFLWNRLGAGLFVLLFLLRKKDRLAINSFFKRSSPKKNKFLVIFNQILGSSGFILQNYAIFLGPVAIVNAMQGFQYAFLLIISAILAALAPKLLKETFSWPIILQKTGAVILVFIGLYFIAV
jgi:drug/metabolite transporter (DMT)-like permease